MNIPLLKTGDIFFYDSYTAHDGKTHHHRCKVLLVGTESLFYDTWWESLNKWTFVPVKKRLTYYRFPLTVLPMLTNLTFNGFEAIDQKSTDKLFLQSPEILLEVVKDEIQRELGDTNLIDTHSDTIVFIPTGPKRGWLKPVQLDAKALTRGVLLEKILEYQNLDFIQNNVIIIHRVGLHSGFPSYNIRTH